MLWAALALAALTVAPVRAGNALGQAVEALDREDYQAAAPLLEQALSEDPDNVNLLFNLGFAYTRLGEEEKAIGFYQKAVETKPDLLPGRANLGMLLMRAGRPAEAIPHFQAVAGKRPEDAHMQLFLGDALSKSGNLEGSLDAYRSAAALDGESAPAALGYGRALASLERYEEAAEQYARAARLDPELSSMRLALAEQAEKAERTELALKLYRAYADERPGEAAVEERIGFLLLKLKRYEEAIPALSRAVESGPSAANRAALAEAYALSDQPRKALPLWREAVAAAPEDPDLRLRYAAALLRRQDFSSSARHYLGVLERDADRVEAWNGLAFSLYRVENYAGALKALAESARRGPPKPANLFLRAVIEDKLKMFEQAKASYEAFLAANSALEDERWKAEQRLKAIDRILRKR